MPRVLACREPLVLFAAMLNDTYTAHDRNIDIRGFLVKETQDLARDVLSPGLLVIHDTRRSGQDNVAYTVFVRICSPNAV